MNSDTAQAESHSQSEDYLSSLDLLELFSDERKRELIVDARKTIEDFETQLQQTVNGARDSLTEASSKLDKALNLKPAQAILAGVQHVEQLIQRVESGDTDAIGKLADRLQQLQAEGEAEKALLHEKIEQLSDAQQRARLESRGDQLDSFNDIIFSELSSGELRLHRALNREFGSLHNEGIQFKLNRERRAQFVEKITEKYGSEFPKNLEAWQEFKAKHKQELNEIIAQVYKDQFDEWLEGLRRRGESVAAEINSYKPLLNESADQISKIRISAELVDSLLQDQQKLQAMLEEIHSGGFTNTVESMLQVVEQEIPSLREIHDWFDSLKREFGWIQVQSNNLQRYLNDSNRTITDQSIGQIADDLYSSTRRFLGQLDQHPFGRYGNKPYQNVVQQMFYRIGFDREFFELLKNRADAISQKRFDVRETDLLKQQLRTVLNESIVTPATLQQYATLEQVSTQTQIDLDDFARLRNQVQSSLDPLTYSDARTGMFSVILSEIATESPGLYSYSETNPARFIQDRLQELDESHIEQAQASLEQLERFLKGSVSVLPKLREYLNARTNTYQKLEMLFEQKYGAQHDFVEALEWKDIQKANVSVLDETIKKDARREEAMNVMIVEIHSLRKHLENVLTAQQNVTAAEVQAKDLIGQKLFEMGEATDAETLDDLKMQISQLVEKRVLENDTITDEELQHIIDEALQKRLERARKYEEGEALASRGRPAEGTFEDPLAQQYEKEAKSLLEQLSQTEYVTRANGVEHEQNELVGAEDSAIFERQYQVYVQAREEYRAVVEPFLLKLRSLFNAPITSVVLSETSNAEAGKNFNLAGDGTVKLDGNESTALDRVIKLEGNPNLAGENAEDLKKHFLNFGKDDNDPVRQLYRASVLVEVYFAKATQWPKEPDYVYRGSEEQFLEYRRGLFQMVAEIEDFAEFRDFILAEERKKTFVSLDYALAKAENVKRKNVKPIIDKILFSIGTRGPNWLEGIDSSEKEGGQFNWSILPKFLAEKMEAIIPKGIEDEVHHRKQTFEESCRNPDLTAKGLVDQLRKLEWYKPDGFVVDSKDLAFLVEDHWQNHLELRGIPQEQFRTKLLPQELNKEPLATKLVDLLIHHPKYLQLQRIEKQQVKSVPELILILLELGNTYYVHGNINYPADKVALEIKRVVDDWENKSTIPRSERLPVLGRRKRNREEMKQVFEDPKLVQLMEHSDETFDLLKIVLDLLMNFEPGAEVESVSRPVVQETIPNEKVREVGWWEFLLLGSPILIGKRSADSTPDIDLRSALESQTISRSYAVLNRTSIGYQIIDVSQENRIMVNDRVITKNVAFNLQSGDIIQFGKAFKMRYTSDVTGREFKLEAITF